MPKGYPKDGKLNKAWFKKGHETSLEVRAKISKATKGKPKSEETRRKMTIANRRRAKLGIGHYFQKGNQLRKGLVPWNKGLTKETDIRVAKAAKDMEGEKNGMWRGGISSERDLLSRKEARWREVVFKKGNYICRKCNKKGCTLNAHHKKCWSKYPELRFKVSNGLILCEGCHKRLHRRYGHDVSEEQLCEFLK